MAGYRTQGPNTSSLSDEEANLQLSPQRKLPETQAMFDGGSGLQNQLSEVRGVEENQDPALPEKIHGECSSSAVDHEKSDVQRSPEECGQQGILEFSQTPPVAHLVATDMTEGVQVASIKLSEVSSVLEPSAGKSAQPGPASHSGSVVDLSSQGAECRQGDSQELPQEAQTEHRAATITREGLHEAIIKLPEGSVVEPSPPNSAQSKSDSESCNVEESGPQVAECSQGLSLATTDVEHPLATAMKEGPHEVNKRPEVVSAVDTSPLNSLSSTVKESGSQTSVCSYGNSKKSPMAVYAEHLAATREVIRAASLKLSKSGSLLESLHKSAPLQSSASQSVSLEDSNLQTAACSQGDIQGLSHSTDLVATAIEEGLQEARIQISETEIAENLVGTAMAEGLQEASIQISETAYAENLVGTAMTEGLQEASIQISVTAYADNLVGTAMTEGLQEARILISETAYAENLVGTAMTEGLQEASIQISETAYAENLVGTAMTEGLQEASIQISVTAYAENLVGTAMTEGLQEASIQISVTEYAENLVGTAMTEGLQEARIQISETAHAENAVGTAMTEGLQEARIQISETALAENAVGTAMTEGLQEARIQIPETAHAENVGTAMTEGLQQARIQISATEYAENLVGPAMTEGLQEATIKLSEGSAQAASCDETDSHCSSQTADAEPLEVTTVRGLLKEVSITLSTIRNGLRDVSIKLSEATYMLATTFQNSLSSSVEDLASQTLDFAAAYIDTMREAGENQDSVLPEQLSGECSSSVLEQEKCDPASSPVECTQAGELGVSQTMYTEHLVGTAVREGLHEASTKLSKVGSVFKSSPQKSASPESASQSGSVEDFSSQAAESSQGNSDGLSEMTACVENLVAADMKGLREASATLSEAGSVLDFPPSYNSSSAEDSDSQASECSDRVSEDFSRAAYAEYLASTATRLLLEAASNKLSETLEPFPHKSDPVESSSLSRSADSGSHVSDCTQGDSHELSQTVYAEHLVGVAIREGLKAASIKISEVGCVVEPSLQKSSPAESSSQSGSEDSSSQAAECSQGDSQGLSQVIACADLVAAAMKEGLQEARMKLSETGSAVKSPEHSHSGSVENSGLQAAEDNRGDNQELSMTVYAEQVTTTTTREGLQEDFIKLAVGSLVEPSPKSASSESTSVSGSTEDSRPQINTVPHKTAAEQLECDQGESPMLSQTASGEHFVATTTELLCVADKLSEASPLSEIEPLALQTTHTHSCSTSEATPATESHGAIGPQHSSGVRHAICHNSQSESDESE